LIDVSITRMVDHDVYQSPDVEISTTRGFSWVDHPYRLIGHPRVRGWWDAVHVCSCVRGWWAGSCPQPWHGTGAPTRAGRVWYGPKAALEQ